MQSSLTTILACLLFFSYKFSHNAWYSDCTLAATVAIIDNMHITESMTDGKLVSEFKALLATWKPLLQKMSIGLEEEKAILVTLQRCAVSEEYARVLSTGISFPLLLQTLHDEEVVSENRCCRGHRIPIRKRNS